MNLPSLLNPSRRCGQTAGAEVFAVRKAGIAAFHHGAPPGPPLR